MATETQLDKLKIKIPYDADRFETEELYKAFLESLLEDAKNIALVTLYPFLDNYEGLSLPSKYNNWQIRAAVELYNTEGIGGIKAYAENGLSWSRENDNCISNALLQEIVPKVGIPKRSDTV